MKKAPLLLLLLISSFTQYGQNSLGQLSAKDIAYFNYYKNGQYYDAVALLENSQYVNATQELINYLSTQKIGAFKAEGFKQWIDNNPNHPLISLARFNYAQQLFYAGGTQQSKIHLSKVKPYELSNSDQADYSFMTGVSLLQDENYENAGKYFEAARKNGFDNHSQLSYYQALTDYNLNNQEEALEGFYTIREDMNYGLSANFYRARILLAKEDYDGVIRLAQEELSEEKSITNAGLFQLLGEAYAKTGETSKADAYFEKAILKYPGKPSSALYYQAGVSKFKLGNVDKALAYLTESGIGSGPFATLSAFQLGRLHIKRNDLENALAAYIEASSSEDIAIKEESIYQAAMLNAKLERYTASIDYCHDYLSKYNQGKWRNEINDLLAQSYLKTSDYDKAIKLLEKISISNQRQKEVYQKVTFQKSLLRFNDGLFDEAEEWFKKSLRYPVIEELTNKTYFYLGEIYLRKENHPDAISSYRQMNLIVPEAQYGIGYALYNQNKYKDAIKYFQDAISSNNWEIKQDARLRLADCYYTTKSYQDAINIYSRLPQSDYVLFQQGMIARNQDKNAEAIQFLNQLSESSNLFDDALFYTAQISFENSAFTNAENGFSDLISKSGKSAYLPKAYLNRAISRNNLGKLNQARADYNFVIEKYVQREEAFSAILGLQDLQQKGVEVGNLDDYIAKYKKANPGSNSLEVVDFESAKSTYFDLDYTHAIRKIKSFLQEYPQTRFRSEATYYLGEAYYRSDSLLNARKVFDTQRFIRNTYTGRVLSRLGSIGIALADFDRAIDDYQMLLDLNLTPKDNYNAMKGLMIAYFENEAFQQVIATADVIINTDWKPLNAVLHAKLFKAKSLIQLNRQIEGRRMLEELSTGEDIFAAESGYLMGLIDYQERNYDASLDRLFEFTSRLGSYTDWMDKAYILIADNYIAKDELFQAKATLRSIIQHSQNEDARIIATDKLRLIEQANEQDTVKEENDD